jgi:hypothetical protein
MFYLHFPYTLLAATLIVSNLASVCTISRREGGPHYTPGVVLYSYSTFGVFTTNYFIQDLKKEE